MVAGLGGETALIAAASRGKVAAMELLLEQRGLDVDATDREGATALTHAVLRHRVPCVEYLLKAKASVRHADAEKRTRSLVSMLRWSLLRVKLALPPSALVVLEVQRSGISSP